MTDYMLTVVGNMGSRDIQVNNAPTIQAAMTDAEKWSGCRVDHGRGGIGSAFDPAVIIDHETGETDVRHDRAAETSMQIANAFKGKVTIKTGEGERPGLDKVSTRKGFGA